MGPGPAHRRVGRARAGLAAVAGFAGVGLALSLAFGATGIGLPCPFLALTGWRCPLCGGTRMGAALLRGDPVAAFAANPALLIVLVLVGLRTLGWAAELIRGRASAPWPGRDARGWLARHWLPVGLALATGYAVARNVVGF